MRGERLEERCAARLKLVEEQIQARGKCPFALLLVALLVSLQRKDRKMLVLTILET